MPQSSRFSIAAAVTAAALTASLSFPAQAQSYFADNVGFFETVVVGDIEVTPVSLIRDRRCADIRFCYRENRFIVTMVLHGYRGLSEVTLELDRPVRVPGGYLAYQHTVRFSLPACVDNLVW